MKFEFKFRVEERGIGIGKENRKQKIEKKIIKKISDFSFPWNQNRKTTNGWLNDCKWTVDWTNDQKSNQKNKRQTKSGKLNYVK